MGTLKFLVTGASGQLGAYVVEELASTGRNVVAWGRSAGEARAGVTLTPVDLEDEAVGRRLDEARPDVVLHLAAVSSAEGVRLDPARGRRVNVEATGRIAAWCARRGSKLVFTTTDLVFAGTKPWNREDDPAEPVLAYGMTKREAEPAVLSVAGGLVARLSLLYGFSRSGRPGHFDRTIAALRRAEPQTLFEDEYRTPLDLATVARALIALAEADASGIVHVAGLERMSRFDLIRRAAEALGIDPNLVRANRRADASFPEPRPADVSLDTARLASLLPGLRRPSIEEALAPLRSDFETGGGPSV